MNFIEGRKTIELVEKYGFPNDKVLFAGLVNGKIYGRTIIRRHLKQFLD